MNLSDSYQAKLRLRKRKPKTRAQLTADEVDEWIGAGRIRYSLLMKHIKENGERCIREILSELKDSKGIRNRVAVYLYKVKTNYTILK